MSRGGDQENDGEAADTRPARRFPRWKLALWGVGAVVALSSPLWGPPALSRLDFFRLRNVRIEGLKYLTAKDILDVLKADTTMSVWDALGPMEERVAAHPGVLSVKVQRDLLRLDPSPGTIVVEVSERVPVAIVPGPDGFKAYDERGVVLPLDPSRAPVDAPVLARADTALLTLLARVRVLLPHLYARVSDVRREGRDELLLRLDAVPVRTMADVSIERLAELVAVDGNLAQRQLRPSEIDLRYKDQVIARLQ
jgi:cell division septal protein FtsQ